MHIMNKEHKQGKRLKTAFCGQNKDAETQSGHKRTLRDGGLVHDSVIDDGEKWRTQTLFFPAGSLSFWGSSVPDFRNHGVLKK